VLGFAVFRSGLMEIHAFPPAWSSACCPLAVGFGGDAGRGRGRELSLAVQPDLRLPLLSGAEHRRWPGAVVVRLAEGRYPFFNECDQAAANLRYRHTESRADGAAALLPVVGWSGGDDPGCFRAQHRGWQIGHPLS
jgi:hypothetical protein